jgi:hypothetical protein
MSTFEQKYASVLRFYPRWYREQRGAEMLSVLAESVMATSGRAESGRPSLRERGALAVGGLRVRLGSAADRTVAGNWLTACYHAAVALLLLGAVGELLRASSTRDGWVWAQAVVSVLAFGFAWKRWHLLAAVAAAAAVALDAIGRHGVADLAQWEQPLAVLVLIPLIGRRRPAASPWFAVLLTPVIVLMELPIVPLGHYWVLVAFALVIALPLTVLEPRVGLTVALIGLLGIVNVGWNMKSLFWAFPDMIAAMWLPTIWPLTVLVLGSVLARRRARI